MKRIDKLNIIMSKLERYKYINIIFDELRFDCETDIEYETLYDIFIDIIKRYSKRKYHNLSHINFCLEQLYNYTYYNINSNNEHQFLLKNHRITNILKLAILLHDIVYDVVLTTSEEASAAYAKIILSRLIIDTNMVDEVCKLILSTKFYEDGSDVNFIDSEDILKAMYLIRDIDLSILGTEKIFYKSYANLIKKEYNIYSPAMRNTGRIDFLTNILSFERIFISGYFFSKFETISKVNIKNELKKITFNEKTSTN